MPSSEALTRGIRVVVASTYLVERSDPTEGEWYFAYHVTISNESERTVQLISRHWIITDADGHVDEVRGPGVIGEQPVLAPGARHEYTSYCPLGTPFGTMHGTYRMITPDGMAFDVEIAPFALGDVN
jgi:ApaG protein